MNGRVLLAISIILLVTISRATIINVPGDQSTIQAGIDAATHGDTVLVQPGTYVERINFDGKNIVVGSPFLITGDTTYILQTIIDGDSSGSVVTFENGEDSAAEVCGFTITNGGIPGSDVDTRGRVYFRGGGINCHNSSPSLSNLVLKGNVASVGGALYCDNASPSLLNVTVTGNSAISGGGVFLENSSDARLKSASILGNTASDHGGGILIEYSSPVMENVDVSGNSAGHYGGGISIYGSANTKFVNVTVIRNTAADGGGIACSESGIRLSSLDIRWNTATRGGGIYCAWGSKPSFDAEDRCNLYQNYAAAGSDVYAVECPTIDVVADTFTVSSPTGYHAKPLTGFTFDILHSKLEQVACDLFVSPEGDDAKSGQSYTEPLKTISYAHSIICADSYNPRIIYLADGTYSPSTTGDRFPVNMVSFVSLSGTSRENTILNAEGQGRVMVLESDEGITVENLTLTGGVDDGLGGGGILCHESSELSLVNVGLTGNSAWSGAGIQCCGSSVWYGGGIGPSVLTLQDVLIIGNTARGYGGGIYCSFESRTSLSNVTITDNAAVDGGGLFFWGYSHVYFDPENRCNIYLNHASETGSDLRNNNVVSEDTLAAIAVVVDTFTVMNPLVYEAYPLYGFNFDILHARIEPVAAQLFVDPQGDDANSGQVSTDPLQTVSGALSKTVPDRFHPLSIHLAGGVYSPSTTGEPFPLEMVSFLSLVGAHDSLVVLDAEGQSGVLSFTRCKGDTIMNLSLTGGSALTGGAVFCEESDPILVNVTISGNTATLGGAVFCHDASPLFSNVTVVDNTSDQGGGIYWERASWPSLVNSIFWNNSPQEIYCAYRSTGAITVAYSNVMGGFPAVEADDHRIHWLEGNINSNPAFTNSESGEFHLLEYSQCIGAGVDSLLIDRPYTISISGFISNRDIEGNPRPLPVGSRPDIGAYESILGEPVPYNTPPVAADDSIIVEQGTSITMCTLENDSDLEGHDLVMYDIDTTNTIGSVIFSPGGVTITYRCLDGFNGVDSLIYIVSDGWGGYDTAVVYIYIKLLAVSPEIATPLSFELHSNFPNPFNPATTLRFDIPVATDATLIIYDILGREVAGLANSYMEPGYHQSHWDGRDQHGRELPSGIYIARLVTPEYTKSIKMVLLK